jgi:hypothetical protein
MFLAITITATDGGDELMIFGNVVGQIRWLLPCLLALSAVGCQNLANSKNIALPYDKTQWETLVVARSQLYWDAIAARKFTAAFSMFTEASRAGVTAENLANAARVRGVSQGKASTASCSPEKCVVTVLQTLRFNVPRVGNTPQTVPIDEVWVWENGDFHLLRPQ